MAEKGAILQNCNNELMKYMEELHLKKRQIDRQIRKLINVKGEVEGEIEILTKQIESVCEILLWKTTTHHKLDKILVDGIIAYDKILESSRLLLTVMKKEMENLDKLMTLKQLFSE